MKCDSTKEICANDLRAGRVCVRKGAFGQGGNRGGVQCAGLGHGGSG